MGSTEARNPSHQHDAEDAGQDQRGGIRREALDETLGEHLRGGVHKADEGEVVGVVLGRKAEGIPQNHAEHGVEDVEPHLRRSVSPATIKRPSCVEGI